MSLTDSNTRRRLSAKGAVAAALVGAILVCVGAAGAYQAWRMGLWPPTWASFSGQAPGTWTQLPGSKLVVGARFEHGGFKITPAENATGIDYNGVRSTRLRDFTGKAWALEVDASHLRPQTGMEIKFRITKNHTTDYAAFEINEANLRFVQKYSGIERERLIPYDRGAHRWWRLRHTPADDMLHWETSADGTTWTEGMKDKRLFDLSKVRIELYGGTFKPVPAPGYVVYSDCRC